MGETKKFESYKSPLNLLQLSFVSEHRRKKNALGPDTAVHCLTCRFFLLQMLLSAGLCKSGVYRLQVMVPPSNIFTPVIQSLHYNPTIYHILVSLIFSPPHLPVTFSSSNLNSSHHTTFLTSFSHSHHHTILTCPVLLSRPPFPLY